MHAPEPPRATARRTSVECIRRCRHPEERTTAIVDCRRRDADTHARQPAPPRVAPHQTSRFSERLPRTGNPTPGHSARAERQFWRVRRPPRALVLGFVTVSPVGTRVGGFARWRVKAVWPFALVCGVVVSVSAVAGASSVKSPTPRHANEVPALSARPTTLPPDAITTYPVAVGADRILLGEGGVWAYDGVNVRRIQMGSDPLVGGIGGLFFPVASGPVLADGRLWAVVTGQDQCAPNSYSYALRATDLASGATVRTVVLPGWCRGQEDDRDVPPQLAVGGDAAWVSSPNPLSGTAFNHEQVVRVDTTTGDAAVTALDGPVGVIAADRLGAWLLRVKGLSPRDDNNLGLLVQGPIQVSRVDPTGKVVIANALPEGTILSGEFAADRAGLWMVYATEESQGSKRQRIALAHIAPDGKTVKAKNVSPWSVASTDGQTWFLGTVGRPRKPQPGSFVDWVLGQVDPRTAKVTRAFRLHLPALGDYASRPRAARSAVPPLQLAAIMDGAVWIDTQGAVGPASQQLLIRVAIDGLRTKR